MDCKIIDFSIKGDERGSLIAVEQNREIPFDIKRVYYIFGTKKDVPRGHHSHKKLQQVLIAVSGSCKVKLDDGQNQMTFDLNRPDRGLFIGKNLWRVMYDFSKDCVLLVLADEYYCPNEYIRDYNQFIKEINNSQLEAQAR